MINYLGGGDPVEWTGSQWKSYGTPPVPCDVRQGSLYKGGYARSVDLFNCPSDKEMPCYYGIGNKIAWSNPSSWPAGATAAQRAALPSGFGLTYSLNEDLCDKSLAPFTIKLSAAVAGRTSRVLFLIHERRGAQNGVIPGQNDGYFQWTLGDPQGNIHWEGTTCSFADGHVKWISTKEIQKIIDLNKASSPSGKGVQWHRNSYYYGLANPDRYE